MHAIYIYIYMYTYMQLGSIHDASTTNLCDKLVLVGIYTTQTTDPL